MRTVRHRSLVAGLLLAAVLLLSGGGIPLRAGDGSGETDESVRAHVEDLASPYFIVRDKAFKKLRGLGRDAEPFLLEGLDTEDPRSLIGCLELLDRLAVGPSLNPRVMKLLDNPDGGVAAGATRYLAAHPQASDEAYQAWSRRILAGGSNLEREAYISAVKRPAPPFQADIILESLPDLPASIAPEAIRALARAGRKDAERSLRECYLLIRRGILEEKLLPVLLRALRDCVTEDSFGVIVQSLLSPSALVNEEARAALAALEAHLYRHKRFEALIEHKLRLHDLFPGSAEHALDLADAIVRYADDPSGAAEILEKLKPELEGDGSTGALLQMADAQRGLALAAFRTGREWKPFLADFPAVVESTPGDHCAGARVEALLLEGALTAVEGEDGRPFFLKALEAAPYEPFEARIDAFLSDRFSVTGLLWRLSRDGGEARCLEVYSQLIAALREDTSRSHYYPEAESLPSLEDRARSSVPLQLGFFMRQDCGNPEGCARVLTEFIGVVHESTLLQNLDMTARAYFNRAAAEMELKDHARAEDSVRRGIKICEDLMSEYRTSFEKERRTFYKDLNELEQRQKALGLLQLATANTMSRADPKRTASLVEEALDLAPQLTEVQMARALVLARSVRSAADAGEAAQSAAAGRAAARGTALKILAAVEEYPDQFYNKSCALLLLGREEEALEYLARHFRESVRPLGTQKAREWALDDPDLESLRSDPRFLELVGDGK